MGSPSVYVRVDFSIFMDCVFWGKCVYWKEFEKKERRRANGR